MVGTHDLVIRIIHDLCKKYYAGKYYSEIHADGVTEDYEPLQVKMPRPIHGLTLTYHPDVWAREKRGHRKEIFRFGTVRAQSMH